MAGMSLHGLPDIFRELPMTDRRVAAEVMDLLMRDTDRATGCAAVVVCDEEDRGLQPVLLHDDPPPRSVPRSVPLRRRGGRSSGREREWDRDAVHDRRDVARDPSRLVGLEDFDRLLDLLLPLVVARSGSVLLGRGRPRGTVADDVDRLWHQHAIDRCRALDVPLLGFYVATGDGIFRLPDPLTAVS